jgi:hypothetical protein
MGSTRRSFTAQDKLRIFAEYGQAPRPAPGQPASPSPGPVLDGPRQTPGDTTGTSTTRGTPWFGPTTIWPV